MISVIATVPHQLETSVPRPHRVPRSTGDPVLDQLDTNGDGIINGFEHDFFLESTKPSAVAGGEATSLPSSGSGEGQPSPHTETSRADGYDASGATRPLMSPPPTFVARG